MLNVSIVVLLVLFVPLNILGDYNPIPIFGFAIYIYGLYRAKKEFIMDKLLQCAIEDFLMLIGISGIVFYAITPLF